MVTATTGALKIAVHEPMGYITVVLLTFFPPFIRQTKTVCNQMEVKGRSEYWTGNAAWLKV